MIRTRRGYLFFKISILDLGCVLELCICIAFLVSPSSGSSLWFCPGFVGLDASSSEIDNIGTPARSSENKNIMLWSWLDRAPRPEASQISPTPDTHKYSSNKIETLEAGQKNPSEPQIPSER